MTDSVFSTFRDFILSVWAGAKSLWKSCLSVLPYLMSIRSGDLNKEVTEQYPDPISSRTADDLPPRTRGLLFNDIEKCTGCKDCQVVCPVDCITVETELGADPNKIWVSRFDIDFAKCIFCGLCVEACVPASLTHTKAYERAVYSISDLTVGFGRGSVTEDQKRKWAEQRKAIESAEGDRL